MRGPFTERTVATPAQLSAEERAVRSNEDARGAYALLTEADQARLEKAQPAYVASVRWHIFDHHRRR